MHSDSVDTIVFVSVLCFQLLNLLDVIIDSAGNKSSDKSLISTNPSSAPQISAVEANANADSNILSSVDDASKVDGSSKPTPSGINVECESHGVLSNLSNAELRLLCSLLAQEGYAFWPMLVANKASFCVSIHHH